MGETKTELKLEELSKAINSDFEWAMNTSLIFENHGVEDPETIGFLKGVAYCTEMYLDILEREDKRPYKSIEDLPEELEPADYITGGNKDE